ncbi:Alpha/Beta hydrolase protein [Cunninghamella echinulata]|nr:Alpha/Beta hydrolase protein [Cunninghamella echinulata]
MSKPTLTGRKLLKSSTLPHGSQWDYIANVDTPEVNGYWFIKDIYQHSNLHQYAEQSTSKADLVLLYIHGGGFRIGHSAMYTDTFIHIITKLEKDHNIKANILSIEYDLAPEANWLQMIDQCETAYNYLLSLGVPSSKIFIGGDSAGGHLTAMLLNRLYEKKQPLPNGGILISPLVCFDKFSPSYSNYRAFDCLPENMLEQDLSELFPELKQSNNQEVLNKYCPLYVSCEGFPSILLTYGQKERFANDCERYIAKLTKQGVNVEVITRHNEPHVYIVTPILASSKRAWASDCGKIADWLGQKIAQN